MPEAETIRGGKRPERRAGFWLSAGGWSLGVAAMAAGGWWWRRSRRRRAISVEAVSEDWLMDHGRESGKQEQHP